MKLEQFFEACRAYGKAAVIAAGIGAVVSSFYGIAEWENGGLVAFSGTVFIGAVIGLFIYLAIHLLHRAVRPAIQRLTGGARVAAGILISLVGGFIGGITGLVTGGRILGGTLTFGDVLEGRGRVFIFASGGIAVLAALAFRAFELLQDRLRETMEQLKQREWAEKELEIARSIQTRLLPPEQIEGTSFAIAARNIPAHMVAGDFYDVVQLDDGSVAIIVADVAGKGMGAALIMASVKAVLPFVARQPVADAMAMLNEKLVQELDRREFVALTFARLFPADGTLHLANAGFPDPYLLRNGSIEPLSAGGARLPLGLRRDVRYETLVTSVKRGDRVVFVSDGIPEAPGLADQLLGYDRLTEILGATSGDGAVSWLDSFLNRVRSEVQPTLADDWTALVLDVR